MSTSSMKTIVSSSGRSRNKLPQISHDFLVVWVLATQHRPGSPPDYGGTVQPASYRLFADIKPVVFMQQQSCQSTGPTAAEKAERLGRALRKPVHDQRQPVMTITRPRAAWLPEQGRHPALVKPFLPAGNGPRAAKQHSHDQTPAVPVCQQKQEIERTADIRIGMRSVVFQKGDAVVVGKYNTGRQGSVSVVRGLGYQLSP